MPSIRFPVVSSPGHSADPPAGRGSDALGVGGPRRSMRGKGLRLFAPLLAVLISGCDFFGGDSGKLDLTETPPAPEVPSRVKGKKATQPLDTTP